MSNIKLFGVDIAAIVDGAMSNDLLAATLTHTVPGTRTPGDPTAGTNPTTTEHSARGIIDDYTTEQMNNELVLVGDKKVLLIGDSIKPAVVPEPGDFVTIEGFRYVVVNVKRDPAAATYTLQSRKPS